MFTSTLLSRVIRVIIAGTQCGLHQRISPLILTKLVRVSSSISALLRPVVGWPRLLVFKKTNQGPQGELAYVTQKQENDSQTAVDSGLADACLKTISRKEFGMVTPRGTDAEPPEPISLLSKPTTPLMQPTSKLLFGSTPAACPDAQPSRVWTPVDPLAGPRLECPACAASGPEAISIFNSPPSCQRSTKVHDRPYRSLGRAASWFVSGSSPPAPATRPACRHARVASRFSLACICGK